MRIQEELKRLVPVGAVGGLVAALGMAAASMYSPEAQATTSFARQTGFSCFACHTRYPSLTAIGKRYFMQGYRVPNIRPQLEHGTRGSWGGDRLSYPLEEYQWWRLRISPFTKEGGRQYRDPNNNEKWFALLPERVSWGASGAIGDHLGFYLEVYYSPHEAPESGFNNARGEFRDSLTEFDELELVWGFEPTWATPGSWMGFYLNNRNYRKVNNRGGTSLYGQQSGAYTDHGSIGVHAYLNEHFYGTIGFLPGRSHNWDKRDVQLSLAWWPFNSQQNDLWIELLITRVKDNPQSAQSQSAYGGTNVRTKSKAWDLRATYTIADKGPHTFDSEIGVGNSQEDVNVGTTRAGTFETTRAGGGFRYWYNRTYGFEFITQRVLKQRECRNDGRCVDFARPGWTRSFGFMYFMATNQLWSLQWNNSRGAPVIERTPGLGGDSDPYNPAIPQTLGSSNDTIQLKLELGW